MPDDQKTTELLGELRGRGWSVAIHNDYRYAGTNCTFWLLTHPSGRYVKGEGHTDEEALAECRAQIERYSLEGSPGPFAVQMKEQGTDGWLYLGFSSYERAEKFWRWVERMQSR